MRAGVARARGKKDLAGGNCWEAFKTRANGGGREGHAFRTHLAHARGRCKERHEGSYLHGLDCAGRERCALWSGIDWRVGAGKGDLVPDGDSDDVMKGGEMDWRAFRAKMVKSTANGEIGETKGGASKSDRPSYWAHAIGNRPEKGCLLLARPHAFMNQQRYFHEAVIFLLDYSREGGAVGVILNRPTQYTLGSLARAITETTDGTVGSSAASRGGRGVPFGESLDDAGLKVPDLLKSCRIYFGGDVTAAAISDVATLVCMHPHGISRDGGGDRLLGEELVTNAREVVSGVYVNGKWFSTEVSAALEDGRIKPKDFKFFAQYAGWAPGQLEMELERNDVWITAACAPELVLKQVIQLPKPLWREVLELMGGEYATMSRQKYGEL